MALPRLPSLAEAAGMYKSPVEDDDPYIYARPILDGSWKPSRTVAPPPPPDTFLGRAARMYGTIERAPAIAANYYSPGGNEFLSEGLTPEVPGIAELVERGGLSQDQVDNATYGEAIGRKLGGVAAELGASPTNAALLLGTSGLGALAGRGTTATAALGARGFLVPEAAAAAQRVASIGRAAEVGQRGISLGFAAQMAPAAGEKIGSALGRYEQEGFTPGTAAEFAGGAVEAGFAGMAGLHGVRKAPAVAPEAGTRTSVDSAEVNGIPQAPPPPAAAPSARGVDLTTEEIARVQQVAQQQAQAAAAAQQQAAAVAQEQAVAQTAQQPVAPTTAMGTAPVPDIASRDAAEVARIQPRIQELPDQNLSQRLALYEREGLQSSAEIVRSEIQARQAPPPEPVVDQDFIAPEPAPQIGQEIGQPVRNPDEFEPSGNSGQLPPLAQEAQPPPAPPRPEEIPALAHEGGETAANVPQSPAASQERGPERRTQALSQVVERRLAERRAEITAKKPHLQPQDVEDLAQAEVAKERHRLTGLPERELFDKAVAENRYGAYASGDGKQFGILNKTHGHVAGDAIIKAMAHVIHDAVTPHGVDVFHTGGDEFRLGGPDEATVRRAAGAATDALRGATIEHVGPDGTSSVVPLPEVDFGYGTRFADADAELGAIKLARKQAAEPRAVAPEPAQGREPDVAAEGRPDVPAVESGQLAPPAAPTEPSRTAPAGISQRKWDRYIKARSREVNDTTASDLKRQYRAKYGDKFMSSLSKEERSTLAKARTDWRRVPEPPHDKAGNPIIPGQEDWTPAERTAARQHAQNVLREIESKGSTAPVGRRLVIDTKGAGAGDVTGEGYGVTSHKEGTAFEDLPYEPAEMVQALKVDKGNPIEQDVLQAAGKDYKLLEEQHQDAVEPPAGVGDETFDPSMFEDQPQGEARYAVKPAPGQLGLGGIADDVAGPKEKKKAPAQTSMFGGEMLQSSETRTTEGREGGGSLFTQEQDARERAEAKSQGGLFGGAEEPPAAPSVAPKETPRALEDVGEKIGGARKDQWAARGLRLADLDGMTRGEEATNVVKGNIWKPDYADLIEKGTEPKAAALLKIVYDKLGAKPKTDTPEGRRQYLSMMEKVRDAFGDVKTAQDVRAARQKLLDAIGWSAGKWKDQAARDEFFSVYKGRSEPFNVGYSDLQRADELVSKGFPNVEPWQRRFGVGPDYRGAFVVYERGSRRRIGEPFTSEAAAIESAKSAYEGLKAEGGGKPIPQRPHLDNLERTGEDVRGGRDVSGDDYIKDFGFRGVEFGNWAAQDERQTMVNLGFEALHDLSGVLGVPQKAVSLDGTLGLAFGARGKGKASAHYEPDKLVINLTKKSGAGSLAHEWGHALDHYFGELGQASKGAANYLSGGRGAPPDVSGVPRQRMVRQPDGSYKTVDVQRHANLRPEMAAAWDDVLGAIFKSKQPQAEAVRNAELALEKAKFSLDRQEKRLAQIPEGTLGAGERKVVSEWIEKAGRPNVAAMERVLTKARGPEYEARTVDSSFYKEATRLSGKSAADGYWARPTEMLARAFESYVFDRIKEKGGKSDYLVHGVEADRYGETYSGNPYPAGLERESINAAFDKLFQTMKSKETDRGTALYRATDEPGQGSITVDHVKAAFPKGEVTERNGGYLVSLPEGRKIRVDVRGEIAYRPEAFEKGYGRKLKEGEEQIVGSWNRIGRDGIIQLAKAGADQGTIHHEAFHSAMDLVLSDKERAAVLRKYGDEEKAAEAYAKWEPGKTPNTLFGRIREFFHRIYKAFKPSAEDAFSEVRSGKAFERKDAETPAETKYATAPKLPPDAKPIPPKETIKEKEPVADKELGRPMRPGEAPRVEKKVAALEEVSPDADLSRNAPRTWKSLDPEIRTRLQDISAKPALELALYNKAKAGKLDDVDVQTLDALVTGKRESYDTLRGKLLKAQEEGRDSGPENVAYLRAALDRATSELALAARSDVEAGTKLARALAARARVMEAAGKSTPDQFLKRVFREIPDVTDEQAGNLLRIMQERPQDLGDALIAAMKPTVLDKFLEGWKNGLVSAPGTILGANPLGNIGEQLVRLGETTTASMLDPLLGGPSTRLKGEARFEFAGAMKGASKSIGQLGKDLRDIAALAPEKIDMDHLDRQPAISGKAGRAIRIPYRLLSVVDDFFKGVGGEAELHKLAWREAKGDRAAAARLIADPPKEMIEAVNKSRLDRTFQNPDKLVSGLVRLRSEHKWLHIIAPFLQTPTNLAKLAWQRSPAGFYEGHKAWRSWKEAIASGADAKEIAKRKGEAVDKLARPLVGTAIMGAFYAVAKSGGMTGSGPTDAKDRNALRDSGWQAYSFVIPVEGGKHLYVPFNRFEPVSTLLGIAADAAEAQNAKSAGDLWDKGLGSVIQNFTSKSFLQGISEAAAVTTDPKQYASQYVSNLVGSFVPNVVAKAAQTIDPKMRETKSEASGVTGIPERIAKTLLSRIPGASLYLPARKGSTGEDVERPGNAITRFLSPVQPSMDKDDADVRRLLVDLDAVPSTPKREVTVAGQKIRLNDLEYETLTKASRQAFARAQLLVKSEGFQRLSDEAQKNAVEDIFQRYSRDARKRLYAIPTFRSRAVEARRAVLAQARQRRRPVAPNA